MDRESLWKLLGTFPNKHERIGILQSTIFHEDGYILEDWLLELERAEPIPIYIAKPFPVPEGKKPLVLVNHSHGGMYHQGKEELIAPSPYLQSPSYAKVLTDLGCTAVCIDMIGFGKRQQNEHELVKKMLLQGQVLWGRMLADSIQVLDWLLERESIDESRIATIGMSMGGLHAWWLAALDERIQVTIDIAGQVELRTLMEEERLNKHGFYYYVPHLLTKFETSEIQAAIAPRKRFSLVGDEDEGCPRRGVSLLQEKLERHYEQVGASSAWRNKIYSCGHVESEAMREDWVMYLKKEWNLDDPSGT